MKRILILTLLSVFINTAKTQSPCCRYIDINVKIIEPSVKTIVYTPGVLYYKLRIYNPGYDTIRSIDTFRYRIYHPYNKNQNDTFERFSWRFPRAVAKGDSIDLIGNLKLTDTITHDIYGFRLYSFLTNSKAYDIIPENSTEIQDNCPDLTLKSIYSPKHVSVNSISNNPLLIYPNPADEFVNINLPTELLNQPCQLKIYDMQGRNIQSLSFTSSTINVPIQTLNFANGNYLIILQNNTTMHKSILTVKH